MIVKKSNSNNWKLEFNWKQTKIWKLNVDFWFLISDDDDVHLWPLARLVKWSISKWSPLHGRCSFFPSISYNSKDPSVMMQIILNGPSQLAPSFPFSVYFPVASTLRTKYRSCSSLVLTWRLKGWAILCFWAINLKRAFALVSGN